MCALVNISMERLGMSSRRLLLSEKLVFTRLLMKNLKLYLFTYLSNKNADYESSRCSGDRGFLESFAK
jgi:hypothetical protein